MAHRSIGRERLGFAVLSGGRSSLDDLSRPIDWGRIETIVGAWKRSPGNEALKTKLWSAPNAMARNRLHPQTDTEYPSRQDERVWLRRRAVDAMARPETTGQTLRPE